MRVTKEMMMEFENKNEELFDKFFNFYSPIIYYYVNKCNINDDDADDCVQEIILNLIRSHNTFKFFKGCYERWLFHIVELHTELYTKDEVRRKHFTNYNDKVFRVSDFRRPEKERILTDLEQNIGEVNYAILVLRLGFKLRFKEISEKLDMSKESVRRRYIIARWLLRKYKRRKK